MKSNCIICNKEFIKDKNSSKCCSVDCYYIKKRKVEWPSKEQLQEDMKIMPMTKIGEKYGVSGNAVRKWIKKYNKGD